MMPKASTLNCGSPRSAMCPRPTSTTRGRSPRPILLLPSSNRCTGPLLARRRVAGDRSTPDGREKARKLRETRRREPTEALEEAGEDEVEEVEGGAGEAGVETGEIRVELVVKMYLLLNVSVSFLLITTICQAIHVYWVITSIKIHSLKILYVLNI